ncbi:MAG: SgcJ/EcaC family oxidoreductase [Gemmataceae bacterium]
MKRIVALLLGGSVLALGLVVPQWFRAGAVGQEPTRPRVGRTDPPSRVTGTARQDELTIRKNLADISVAFNKGDVEAILALWTEDGEYIHESGTIYRGKPALRVFFKKALEGFKGYKQSIKPESVRLISADVALEESTVTTTSPENVTQSGQYTSVWVKQGGKWLLSRVRDLPEASDDETKPASFEKLKGLNWMIGEWTDKEGKDAVKMTCKWTPAQAFFQQEYVIKQADGKDFNVLQLVGWDPYNQQVRSWMFDSAGGFAIGWWTREGNTWSIRAEGVYPDGRLFTSTDTLRFVDDNNAQWTSKNREVDDQPLADVELNFTRKTRDR